MKERRMYCDIALLMLTPTHRHYMFVTDSNKGCGGQIKKSRDWLVDSGIYCNQHTKDHTQIKQCTLTNQ